MDATHHARLAFDTWRERTHADWLDDDPHFASLLVLHHVPTTGLAAFAQVCARQIDPLVRENNRDEHLPVLRRFDPDGNRIERVTHHPSYAEIGRLAHAPGWMGQYAVRGRELHSMAFMYLFAQNGEAGHACPMACTAGLVKLLREVGNPRPDWMEALTRPDWDRQFRGAQFLTEVQGGSDVGANAVQARPLPNGRAAITGEKWFCSVIDADLFLMTARPDGGSSGTTGLRGYVVPRVREDGTLNGFYPRRLKYKLGTRSMASAEVDFVDAEGLEVADFTQVMEHVINTSRLLNALSCCAILQRAAREADGYARVRTAFGQPVIGFPSVARRLADLWSLVYGAKSVTFALAALADQLSLELATPSDKRAHRMLLNLNKIWTSEACTTGVRYAIEILGGNGAIEEFSVLPRLLRDAVVLEAWEGGHNVLYSQILRDAQRLGLHVDVLAWLRENGADPDALELVQAQWAQVLSQPEAPWRIRDLCDGLRPLVQATILRAEGRGPSPDPRSAVAAAHVIATRPGASAWEDVDLPSRVQRLLDR